MKSIKILIIGQAPPSVNQRVPYDTTMLYEILKWVDISKESAQDIFEFDAVYDKFPGYSPDGGHLIPSQEQMEDYWERSLKDKVSKVDKIIVLGNVAKKFILDKFPYGKNIIFMIHPSKRNYQRIISNKKYIIEQLEEIL